MPISDAQWACIDKTLHDCIYNPVSLDCDGYTLTLVLARIDTYRLAICIRVDGQMRGEWISTDCEERRRFFCPCKARLYKKDAFKRFTKSSLKRWKINPDAATTYYKPYWTDIRRLRRHLERNNNEIALIDTSICPEERMVTA